MYAQPPCPSLYCPLGSVAPVPCPRGQYCATSGLALPTGDCTAGSYCHGSASVPDPAPCSKGHHRPQGTSVEVACSPGTFSGMSHLLNIFDFSAAYNCNVICFKWCFVRIIQCVA